MALSKSSLKSKIETELKAAGFVVDGEHAQTAAMAAAMANAIVDEITANAAVTVAGGSSSGSYKVS